MFRKISLYTCTQYIHNGAYCLIAARIREYNLSIHASLLAILPRAIQLISTKSIDRRIWYIHTKLNGLRATQSSAAIESAWIDRSRKGPSNNWIVPHEIGAGSGKGTGYRSGHASKTAIRVRCVLRARMQESKKQSRLIAGYSGFLNCIYWLVAIESN